MLAAIREIYDQAGMYAMSVVMVVIHWEWRGRMIVVGACTEALESAHAVVATMGDRFVLIRIDSDNAKVRMAANKQALKNTGKEEQMREELAAVVGNLLKHVSAETDVTMSDDEQMQLHKAAEIVTKAEIERVERDYKGEIIDSHAPEMPTRFTKQLTQVVRGGTAIGLNHEQAMQLAIRCAKDSIPPLRLKILLDIAANPHSRPGDVRDRSGQTVAHGQAMKWKP